jgi:hypothetical protein
MCIMVHDVFALQDMQRGRGYEISPEHKAYMQVMLQQDMQQLIASEAPFCLCIGRTW